MRLIKKSKFYDGFQNENMYFEIFENPTDAEINEIRKLGYNLGD